MIYTEAPGGLWVPNAGLFSKLYPAIYVRGNHGLLDANAEEFQMIGRVRLPGGAGTSKTFGTSGSKIGFSGGSPTTFVATATLRVGVKDSSTISTTSGPPARATPGATFNVYKDLIGGTDTINSVAWNSISMASGTPFTVNHGDLIAVCFYLAVGSGTQAITFSCHNNQGVGVHQPQCTLVTGGTPAIEPAVPNCILTFDDGSIGWLEGTFQFIGSLADTNVGNGNISGNIFQFPFPVKIDGIRVSTYTSGTTNFDVGFWSDPSGTPTPTDANISFDPQQLAVAGQRSLQLMFATPIELAADTPILAGVKQNSATDCYLRYYDVDATDHLQSNGLDANTYAAQSVSGGAASALNSGKRRFEIWARIHSVEKPNRMPNLSLGI